MRFTTFALAIAALVLVPLVADAETYKIDAGHSSVEFSVRHLVARSTGRFNDFAGTIDFDAGEPGKGRVSVVIQATSINTNSEDRDGHLRGADFFDVENHPEIRFEGETSTRTDDGFDVTGILSMHGVDKEVTLPVEFLGVGADPWGNERAGFYAELKIDRQDWGINWNKGLDKGGFVLGDEVKIVISIEAMRPIEQTEGT